MRDLSKKILQIRPWTCAALNLLLFVFVGADAQAQQARPQGDSPRERAEWFYRQRAYPFATIPAGARFRALGELNRMLQAEAQQRAQSGALATQAVRAGGPTSAIHNLVWTLIGPQPASSGFASGRVSALAVDPGNANVVYLGGAQGGVWKTTDGGTTWVPLTDAQPSLAIGSIALDPSNSNIVYVGTGEGNFSADSYYGAGVLKSTDGGVSWTQLGASLFGTPFGSSGFSGGSRIGSIAVHPTNGQIVLAALDNTSLFTNGIFRSTDGGMSWTNVQAGSTGTKVVFDPTNGSNAFAALHGGGVYRSSDGGATWIKADAAGTNKLPTTDVGRIALALAPSTPTTLFAGIANSTNGSLLGLFKSTDSGTNWTQLSNTPDYCTPQCWYDNVIAVVPNNANVVFAGGSAQNGTLFRSTDGGNTWSEISDGANGVSLHVDHHALAFSSGSNKLYVGNDGGVWSTTDVTNASVNWTNLNNTLAITQFYPGLSTHPSNSNIVLAGTQDNGTQRYAGALSWNHVTCGDGGWTAIDPAVPTNTYTTCQYIDIRKSTSGGDPGTWSSADSGIDLNDRVSFIPPFVIDPSNPQRLYFGTYRVYQTLDGAGTWTAISPDLTGGGRLTAIAVAPSDSNTIYAGSGDARVNVTTNAGAGPVAVWVNRSAGLPNRVVTQIAVDFNSAQTAYVTFSGFSGFGDNQGHVFKTVNGGANWIDVSGNLPNIPVNDIVIDVDLANTLYVGTDIGVFRTTDGGTTWATMGTGFPRVAVLSLKLHQPSRILRAATHGRSVWDLSLRSPTTTTLVSSPNPSTFGQAVTLTATVSPPAASGKVTFYDGTTVLGTSTLSGGVATLTTTLLPSGSRSLRAYYGADATYSATSSPTVVQTVLALPQNGFQAAVNYDTGTAPQSVVVGDFNGDGKADLAVANQSSNNVSVLLGNGNGTFQAAMHYTVGSNPQSVAIGDLDGDGKADVAVANSSDDNVTVLRGNGDGTFQPAVNSSAGSGPVVVGDFNGDGKPDLAVANGDFFDSYLCVLLGKGDGTFHAAVNYDAGSVPLSVAIRDFNGDGKADFAVANLTSNYVNVILGNGDGSFQAPVSHGGGGAHTFVTTGDLNGDGRWDLVGSGLAVGVLLGNGDGTFEPGVYYNVAGGVRRSGVVGDFNGDGKEDLAVANASSNALSILLGNGDGTLQSAVNYVAGGNPFFLALGDFNGDGRADLAVTNYDSNNVSILLGVAAFPDLTISKTHTGNFTQGQTGATYIITVSNGGPDPTAGTVTVTDTLPAGLTATTITGTGWSCTLGTLTCTRSNALAAGQSYPAITLTVNVASNAAASITNTAVVSGGGDLNTANNAASNPTTVNVGGAAVGLSPASLNFGNQAVGIPSGGQTVTVTNTGTNSLTITNVAASGDFAQTNDCASVAVAGSCTITATFTPTLSGLRAGSITITDNASNSPQLVHLFGAGISGAVAKVSLSKVALNFGAGAAGGSQAVTLTNSGGASLTVNSVTPSGDFSQTNDCSTVAASASCTITVTFSPAAVGRRVGAITIVDTASGSPHVIRLFGMGTSGTAPGIGFSSASLNFDNQASGTTSAAKIVTVTNTGTATLTITAVSPSGDFSASGCVTSLAPAATCTISVTFTPTTTGDRRGSVALTNNVTGSPQVIRLFGKGT